MDSTGSTNAGSSSRSQNIRIGIGGWTFEPWRDNFYPAGLAHSKELQYASRQLTSIEVNGTYYSTFKPPTFAKWRDETPEGFMFSLKANRFATNRRVLAEAGEMEEAVKLGLQALGTDGVLLLSPGAPSFPRYLDYVARGRHFAKAAGFDPDQISAIPGLGVA